MIRRIIIQVSRIIATAKSRGIISDSESESFAAASTGPHVTERKKKESDEIIALKKLVIELQLKLDEAVLHGTRKEDIKSETAAECVIVDEDSGVRQIRNEMAGRIPDIRELKEVVHPFDPRDVTCPEAARWLQDFEETATVYGWKDQVKLHCARLSLGGCAKLWWEGSQSRIKTWQEFKSALVAGFPASRNQAFYHNWLAKRKWTADESPTEYTYTMLAMGRKGELSEETTTSYIVNGLGDMWRRARVAVSRVTTIEGILKEIAWVESIAAVAGQNTHMHAERPGPGRKCFTCGSGEHVARFCNQRAREESHPATSKWNEGSRKPKCYKCNELGHISIDCPKRAYEQREEMRRSEKVENHRMHAMEAEDDTFQKVVRIGNRQLKALIDSGAKVSTICKNFVGTAGQPRKAKGFLHGFGGSRVAVEEKVKTKILVDGVEIEADLWVVPDDAQHVEMIVGRDVMTQTGITITFKAGEVTFENNHQPREREETTYTAERDEIPTGVTHNDETPEHIRAEELEVEGGYLDKTKIVTVVNKYRMCFAKEMRELGKALTGEMKIETVGKDPTYVKPRKMPYAQESVVQEIVRELYENDIIEPSASPYNSPIVLVKKKTGKWRMAVDYRELNKRTVKDRYPAPEIERCINALYGSNVFITLDLYSGYYQIPVEPASREKTAFSTPEGQFQFKRMPFGLVNSAAVFQRTIDKMLRELRQPKIVAYVDDIIIGAKTNEEAIELLEQLLEGMRKNGLTINLQKSKFLKSQVEFLGVELAAGGIKPGAAKCQAVTEFPTPTDSKQVQRFLGLAGYFRRFVEKFSIIARPLHALTRKDIDFKWGKTEEEAFKTLKHKLSERPLLALYDREAEIELHTDASREGLAGILLTKSKEGWKPISYFSRKTTDEESNYHSYDLEVLAVVSSVERFREYLLGRPFVIKTDCSAVRDTYTKRDMNARIARWFLKLQEYDFQIAHRVGNAMTHVDALSRNAVEPAKAEGTVAEKIFTIEVDSDDFLATLQRQDEKLLHLVETLQQPYTNDTQKQVHDNYTLEGQRLMRKVDGESKWVVPTRARWRMIQAFHDDRGHFGADRTLEGMRKKYWFPKMRKYVQGYIQACPQCAYNKKKAGKPEGYLHPIPKEPTPFHTIHLDHVGPFIKSARGNQYLLLVICGFSKFVILRAVSSTKTAPVLKCLEEITAILGTPSKIITDRGTAYTSRAFEEYCEKNASQHIKVAVGTPRANGQVERYNRTILTALRCSIGKDNRRWDEQIGKIQWEINNTRNSTTKHSPSELVLSYRPRDIYQNIITLILHDEDDNRILDAETIRRDVIEQTAKEQSKQKAYFDQRRTKARKYAVGDMVLVERDILATGESRKLEPRYKGPYAVATVLPNDRYIIEDIPGAQRTQRPLRTVYAADRMKRWISYQELEDEEAPDEDSSSDEESN